MSSNQQLDGEVEQEVDPQMEPQHVEVPRKKKRRRGCKGGKGGKSKNFQKIFISVTGSSHANFNHYFPQLLKAKLSNDKRFECPANGWFDCRGGRTLLEIDLEELTSFLEQISPFPNLQIFVIGGNDLRNLVSPELVVNRFREIVQSCLNIQRLQILICGIIPSPPNENTANPEKNLKAQFVECNQLLRELELEFPEKVTFLDVAKSLTDEHGDIRMEFYEQKYQSDVHLSKRGCQILVDLLYRKMCGGIGKF